MLTEKEFKQEMVIRCLDEMYQASQPSITWEEVSKSENGINEHYLSSEEYKFILEKYADLYNLKDQFIQDCDILIRDAEEGYSVDKYIERDGDNPGYRGYEHKPPLKEQIGEEMANKFIEFIKSRRNFYRFNKEYTQFSFTIMNYSPNSNKKTVIETWKEKGVDIEIVDRDPDWNYERYYLGWSEKDIEEEKEFLNAEREEN